MGKLLSYDSLKKAVVDRSEDFSENPRFSLLLMRDIDHVLKVCPEKIPPAAALEMVQRLVLPSPDMTIPSHVVQALVETVISAFGHTHNSKIQLTPEHALAAQDILANLQAIRIYYTRPFSPVDMQRWEKVMTIAFNMTLNFFASAASNVRGPNAAKEIVQFAESMLMEVGSSSIPPDPERLLIKPDTISFNTVIMAWAKSAPSAGVERKRQQVVATNAAERAEAILKVMIEISADLPSVKPSDASFAGVLSAWSAVRSERAHKHVFDRLLPLMDKLFRARKGPAMTLSTLMMASQNLAHHKSARAIQQHISQILKYQKEFNLPLDTLLCNAILTAYRRVDSDDFPDSYDNARMMVEFFNDNVRSPDRLSYALVVGGIRRSVQKLGRGDDFFCSEAKRLLIQAGDLADIRMQNDVLGVLVQHPDDSEIVFNGMGESVDYHSYMYLLSAYERCSNASNDYAEKADALLRRMEAASESHDSLRPQTSDYNAVIIAWLARNDIDSVENAHAVLQRLLKRYHGQLEKLRNSRIPFHIKERPNSTSFITIMTGFSKRGNLKHVEVVEDMLQEMGDMQIAKSQASEELMNAHANVAQNSIAANVLLDMYVKYSKVDPSFLRKAENLMKRTGNLEPSRE